jgi:uncharacterized protein YbjT (DUF2867 family)
VKRILVAGGTGLVGGHILQGLKNKADYHVTLISRRASENIPDTWSTLIAPLSDWRSALGQSHFDVTLCALGTTLKQAGSKQAFEDVDFRAVAALADSAKSDGAQQFILVSSVGADAESANFYLKTKGRAEAVVRAAGFNRVDVFRPGLLRGVRDNFRLGERLSQIAQTIVDPLLLGPLEKYHSAQAHDVASAMIACIDAPGSGFFVHEHKQIMAARAARA